VKKGPIDSNQALK